MFAIIQQEKYKQLTLTPLFFSVFLKQEARPTRHVGISINLVFLLDFRTPFEAS